MPKTLPIKQAVTHGRFDVRMDSAELATEPLSPHAVLIRTRASFISAGTELSIYNGTDPHVDIPGAWCCYPYRPGYANVGEILAVGDAVDKYQVGQRVFTFAKHASHHIIELGPESLIVAPPEGLSDIVAAGSRMGLVAMASIRCAKLFLNDWVVVLGLGNVGNLAAQLFQLNGARVIGVDPVAQRRELAQACGIRHVVGGTPEEIKDQVMSLTGTGAHISVDAVGHSQVVLQGAELTRPHGQVILLGTPRVPVEGNLTSLLAPAHTRWLTITGALEWGVPQLDAFRARVSVESSLEVVFSLVDQGRLQVEPLISHQLAPEQIKQGYDGLLNQRDEYLGVALKWV